MKKSKLILFLSNCLLEFIFVIPCLAQCEFEYFPERIVDRRSQCIDEGISEAFLRNKNEICDLLKASNKWQRVTEFKETDINAYKKNLGNRSLNTFPVVTKINHIEKENKTEVTIIILDLQHNRQLKIGFVFEDYFVEQALVKRFSINFFVLLKSKLSENTVPELLALLDFQPFDNCEIATYTSHGGSLADFGIDCTTTYYCMEERIIWPAVINTQKQSITLPYDNDAMRYYIFERMIGDKANRMTSPLRKIIKNKMQEWKFLPLAFNTRKSGNDIYVEFKIKYLPDQNQAAIHSRLFYKTTLENKTYFSDQEFAAINREAFFKTLSDERIPYIENIPDYVSLQSHRINGILYKAWTFDTGNFFQEVDKKIDRTLKLRLEALGFTFDKQKSVSELITAFRTGENTSPSFDKLELYGFNSGQWQLSRLLEATLDELLSKTIKNSSFSQRKITAIYVIGYSDGDPIRPPYLDNFIKDARYFSCQGEEKYISLRDHHNFKGSLIGAKITDNCQLSFMRAYKVSRYLEHELQRIHLFYAGGGEINYGNKYYNRKVIIRLVGESDGAQKLDQ